MGEMETWLFVPALVQLLFKWTVLLGAALILRAFCVRGSASLRHSILTTFLLALPFLIAWECCGPRWNWIGPRWLARDVTVVDSSADSTDSVDRHWVGVHSGDAKELAEPVQPREIQNSNSNLTVRSNLKSPTTDVEIRKSNDFGRADLLEDRQRLAPQQSVPVTSFIRTSVEAESNNRVDLDQGSSSASSPTDSYRSAGNTGPALMGLGRGWIFAWLCGVWMIGVVLMAGRLIYGWFLAGQSITTSLPVNDGQLAQLHRLVPALREAPVSVVVARYRGQMPMCLGLVRKTIVLPIEFQDWDTAQLKSVVSHELAHLMRNDTWVNLFSRIQTVILWFHPLQHWYVRCLQIDCEVACDDWVIGQGMTPSMYAKALLNVSTQYRSVPTSPVSHSMASKQTSLEYRVKSVLDEKSSRLPASLFWRLSIACIALLFMSVVAAIFLNSPEATLSAADSDEALIAEVDQINEIEFAVSDDGQSPSASPHPQLLAVNLGNWLMLEPWLLDLNGDQFKDQHSILTVLNSRFGEEKTEHLMDVYRRNWITLADLKATKKLGFNAVRLPFDFGLLESAGQPQTLRTDAFEWLDHAVNISQQAGLMVILDLHGAPGGQSLDGPSGNSAENNLWTNEQAKARTIWLWQQIAQRYANSETVVAYDIVNEPYGDFSQDLRETMLDLFDRIYQAIRKVDSKTLIYAPATLDGFAFYGDPADRGWVNVGFTQHAYPGLFDGRPAAVRSHEMFIKHWVEPVDRSIDDLNVPFLLGEYNVVFDDAGGAPLTAWYASEYGRRGWSTAIWTLKRALREPTTDENSWALLTNDRPYHVNLKKDSYDELTEKFESLSHLNWHTENKFLDAFSGQNHKWEWPKQNQWMGLEIGTDAKGSSILRGENWVVTGAGRDIFGNEDRFHFQCQPIDGNFAATGRILWIDETSPWAKSGWMIREDDSVDAAHLFIHAMPDGKIMVAGRDSKGSDSWQKTVSAGALPVVLEFERKSDNVVLGWTDASGKHGSWTHTPEFLNQAKRPLFGLAVCSLSPGITTTAGWDSYSFRRSGAEPRSVDLDPATALVSTMAAPQDGGGDVTVGEAIEGQKIGDQNAKRWVEMAIANPSFETADQSDDTAKSWNRWGQWINRETQWEPVKDGRAIIGYHHFRIEDESSSGLWQDVDVQPGQRLRFQVAANADLGNASTAESVELRIEELSADKTSTVLARKKYPVTKLATLNDWSTIEVTGRTNANRARLVIEITPSKNALGGRDGSIKLDSATLAFAVTDAPTLKSNQSSTDDPMLSNASFEEVGENGQLEHWAGWGQFFERQNEWTPVKDGNAILAYQHYRTSGSDSSGVWQDVDVTPGERLKFSVFANVDFGKGGTKPPSMVEIKIESPSDNGTMVTLAKKTVDAKNLSSGDRWSLLSIEAVALQDKARLLIVAHPSSEDGERDGALKFDLANAEVVHQ